MIYLDNNATTKIDSKVFLKHCEVLRKNYGNASSLYPMGVESKNSIEDSRIQVAKFINADLNSGDRVIFTSCATESNNAVFHSVLGQNVKGQHIIISEVEHPSVYNMALYYEEVGCEVTRIKVDTNGVLNVSQLMNSIRNDTSIVSLMMVNSETGVLNDIENISKMIKQSFPKVLIHTDAVQAAGKTPIDTKLLNVDFLTLSGHKFHAPKGIGVLYIKRGVSFNPFIIGGHQEMGLRAGTENVANIVALGEAAEIAKKSLEDGINTEIEALRDYMEQELKRLFPYNIIFGEQSNRIGNTTNIGFKAVDGTKLVLGLAQKGVFVSSGTACNSISASPSRVLSAMNAPSEYIRSIRISLSKENCMSDIQTLLSSLKELI